MTQAWWRDAVFYEIYVRSFADSNDDGVGDLPGITSRLDYVKRLGVDAVWLTPFYPSPQKDHGYDVADYVDVNPEYGTLDDFDRLVERAHDLRLKVLVDLVPNHTSDQHPWFTSALSSLDDPHRSWYHFADPKPDGSPPNNWTSAFGGPAWARDEASGQWYLHLFAPEQPDLNWWNPEVQAEFEKIVRFWLERGADGFRIDVAPALFKRADLADRPMIRNGATGALEPDPAFSIFDQPQLHDVYKRWREIASGLTPERVLVGEIFEPRRHSAFVAPDQLNMAFALIVAPWDAARWKRLIDAVALEQHNRSVANYLKVQSPFSLNYDFFEHLRDEEIPGSISGVLFYLSGLRLSLLSKLGWRGALAFEQQLALLRDLARAVSIRSVLHRTRLREHKILRRLVSGSGRNTRIGAFVANSETSADLSAPTG